MAEGGWLGVAMPESVGGAGLGLTEAAVMMQTVAQSGAGFSGASSIHLNIFGPMPLVKFGSDAQRGTLLPPLISGEDKMCFARHRAEFRPGHLQPGDRAPSGPTRLS